MVELNGIDVPCPDSAGTDCIVLETTVTLDFGGRPARSRQLDVTTISSASEEVIQSVSNFESFNPFLGGQSGQSGRNKLVGVGAETIDSAIDSVQPFGTASIVSLCMGVLLVIVLTVLAVRNRRMDEEDREPEDQDFLEDQEA